MNNKIERNILIIEDDYTISNILTYALSSEGFKITTAFEGNEGLRILKDNKIDLILLDVMLPDSDGFKICKMIISMYQIPIIFITARDDILDRVTGLELGADDYIVKPFDIREVIARVKTVFRRLNKVSKFDNNVVHINNNITIHKEQRKIFNGDNEIKLTRKEYDLLLMFCENKGKVFSRDYLLDRIWGYEYVGNTRTVDIHITRLRKKLGFDKNDTFIETLYGIGYRFGIEG